jgi:hypothetical protein
VARRRGWRLHVVQKAEDVVQKAEDAVLQRRAERATKPLVEVPVKMADGAATSGRYQAG